MSVLKSLSNLGQIVALDPSNDHRVPNLAYCSVKLYFDKVYVTPRMSKKGKPRPPLVTLKRGDKTIRITADRQTQESWLQLNTFPDNGQAAYIEMPAKVAERVL